MTSSRGARICSSRSGVSVATFVVVAGTRRWVLGVREELAMIKLNESKLCIVEVMVVLVRRGDYRVEGLLSLLVFSVFAKVADEDNSKNVGRLVESKNPGQNTNQH